VTSDGSDWRARLTAALKTSIDSPEAKMAIAVFTQTVRTTVRRTVLTGASTILVKAMAKPIVRAAYAQMLYRLQIPFEEPSPEFVSYLIDSVIDEVRSRKGSAA
jgi:hypothetical protein